MTINLENGDTIRMERDLQDVTSANRPDTGWVQVDAEGHVHRWLLPSGAAPARYDPSVAYQLSTLRFVVTGKGYYPDGSEYDIGHYECRQCGEHVRPRTTADTVRQFIPMMRHVSIELADADHIFPAPLTLGQAKRFIVENVDLAGDEVIGPLVMRLLALVRRVEPLWSASEDSRS